MTSMAEQCRILMSAGHTVHLLIAATAAPTNASFRDIDIITVTPSFSLGNVAYHLPIILPTKRNRQAVRAVLHDITPDIIHLQSELSLSTLVAKEAQHLSIPIVNTVHTFFWTAEGRPFKLLSAGAAYLAGSLFHGQLLKGYRQTTGIPLERVLKSITLALSAKSSLTISPSRHQAAALQAAKLSTPIRIVPNAYTSTAATKPPQLVKTTEAPLRLVWIGRCDPEKRLATLLEATDIARRKTGQRIVLDIIGEGETLAALQKAHAHQDTYFHGHLPHSQVITHIDDADALALTSYHFDNQPMVIAEAMSRWRPVLYCDERLTEGVDTAGYFIPSPDTVTWADHLSQLAGNKQPLIALSNKAKAVAIFRPETYLAHITEIYSEAINNR